MTLTPVDLLAFDARLERLDELAEHLVGTLRHHQGPIPLHPFPHAAAVQRQLPTVEVK